MSEEFFSGEEFFGLDDESTEERLQHLAELESDTCEDFFFRVHQSIERRSLVAHFAGFACDLSPIIMTELGQVFWHVLRVGTTKAKEKK